MPEESCHVVDPDCHTVQREVMPMSGYPCLQLNRDSRQNVMTRQHSDHPQNQAEPVHLRERDLASRWKMSQRTLQRWRAEGYGPLFIRIGGSIRYRMADVLDYERRHIVTGGHD